ncbi:MAG: hypothetical protein UV94_C0041G0008 [Parcubacteria group bacterium GW2011_GWC1_43_30]|nr:MAG: hypothetical protein UV94_C0041G0008 [Parcubacteria group bacterium GW2011_GWC1_43_30]
MDKPSAFIDSSVFIAALLSDSGGSFYILNNFADKVIFKTNNYVLDEINGVLNEKFSEQNNLYSTLFLLLSVAKILVLSNPPKSSLAKLAKIISKKDTPILAGAIEHCDYLITLDNEFFNEQVADMAKLKNLQIFKPKDFIQLFRNEK